MSQPESKVELTILCGTPRARFSDYLKRTETRPMTKILPFALILMMALHIIKPLGWPGLKKRGDFWKIAAGAILAMFVVVLVGHAG
jgi:hypothetical protein